MPPRRRYPSMAPVTSIASSSSASSAAAAPGSGEVPSASSLRLLTVAQLKARLEGLGVPFRSHDTKWTLISALSRALAQQAEEQMQDAATAAAASSPAAAAAATPGRSTRSRRRARSEDEGETDASPAPAAAAAAAVDPAPASGRSTRRRRATATATGAAATAEPAASATPASRRVHVARRATGHRVPLSARIASRARVIVSPTASRIPLGASASLLDMHFDSDDEDDEEYDGERNFEFIDEDFSDGYLESPPVPSDAAAARRVPPYPVSGLLEEIQRQMEAGNLGASLSGPQAARWHHPASHAHAHADPSHDPIGDLWNSLAHHHHHHHHDHDDEHEHDAAYRAGLMFSSDFPRAPLMQPYEIRMRASVISMAQAAERVQIIAEKVNSVDLTGGDGAARVVTSLSISDLIQPSGGSIFMRNRVPTSESRPAAAAAAAAPTLPSGTARQLVESALRRMGVAAFGDDESAMELPDGVFDLTSAIPASMRPLSRPLLPPPPPPPPRRFSLGPARRVQPGAAMEEPAEDETQVPQSSGSASIPTSSTTASAVSAPAAAGTQAMAQPAGAVPLPRIVVSTISTAVSTAVSTALMAGEPSAAGNLAMSFVAESLSTMLSNATDLRGAGVSIEAIQRFEASVSRDLDGFMEEYSWWRQPLEAVHRAAYRELPAEQARKVDDMMRRIVEELKRQILESVLVATATRDAASSTQSPPASTAAATAAGSGEDAPGGVFGAIQRAVRDNPAEATSSAAAAGALRSPELDGLGDSSGPLTRAELGRYSEQLQGDLEQLLSWQRGFTGTGRSHEVAGPSASAPSSSTTGAAAAGRAASSPLSSLRFLTPFDNVLMDVFARPDTLGASFFTEEAVAEIEAAAAKLQPATLKLAASAAATASKVADESMADAGDASMTDVAAAASSASSAPSASASAGAASATSGTGSFRFTSCPLDLVSLRRALAKLCATTDMKATSDLSFPRPLRLLWKWMWTYVADARAAEELLRFDKPQEPQGGWVSFLQLNEPFATRVKHSASFAGRVAGRKRGRDDEYSAASAATAAATAALAVANALPSLSPGDNVANLLSNLERSNARLSALSSELRRSQAVLGEVPFGSSARTRPRTSRGRAAAASTTQGSATRTASSRPVDIDLSLDDDTPPPAAAAAASASAAPAAASSAAGGSGTAGGLHYFQDLDAVAMSVPFSSPSSSPAPAASSAGGATVADVPRGVLAAFEAAMRAPAALEDTERLQVSSPLPQEQPDMLDVATLKQEGLSSPQPEQASSGPSSTAPPAAAAAAAAAASPPAAPVAAASSSAAPAAAAAVPSTPSLAACRLLPVSTLVVHSFLVLLSLPQLLDPTSFLCNELFSLLAVMPPLVHDEFVSLVSVLPAAVIRSELRRWVEATQAFLSIRVLNSHRNDQPVRGAVRVLALFHRINEAVHARFSAGALSLSPQSASAGHNNVLSSPGGGNGGDADSSSSGDSPALERAAFLNDALSAHENLVKDFGRLRSVEERQRARRLRAQRDREAELAEAEAADTTSAVFSYVDESSHRAKRVRFLVSQEAGAEEKASDVGATAAAGAAPAASSSAATAARKPKKPRPAPVNPNGLVVESLHDFCFAQFPFLFDAAALSRIVLGEAQREQQELVRQEREDYAAQRMAEHSTRRRGRRGGNSVTAAMRARIAAYSNSNAGTLMLVVRRAHILEDTLAAIQKLPRARDLKRPLKIQFAGEEGIDAGGVKREFFALLFARLLSPEYGMWQHEHEKLVINPMALASIDGSPPPKREDELSAEARNTLAEFELTGTLLGLAVHNNVQIELAFPRVFWKKLLHAAHAPAEGEEKEQQAEEGEGHGAGFGSGSGAAAAAASASPAAAASSGSAAASNVGSGGGRSRVAPLSYTLDELSETHPELAKGLYLLLRHRASSAAEFESTFSLEWSVEQSLFGAVVSRELEPGSAGRPVTLENREAYVAAYVKYVLHDAVAMQFVALTRGFFSVASRLPLRLLSAPGDLELLVCGNQAPQFDELEQAATYEGWHQWPMAPASFLPGGGGRGTQLVPQAAVIGHFWSWFHGLTVPLKRRLLAFVSGSDRIPIKGLRHATFQIVNGGMDERKLPESHTCFSQLVLPVYKDAATLRAKMMLALQEGHEGFALR